MDKFIKTGLIFLIIYCPLAFGAVHIFSFTVMEIGVLLLGLGWLLSRILASSGSRAIAKESGKRGSEKKSGKKCSLRLVEWTPLHTLGVLFISIILLQLIPWPSLWVKTISPGTFRVHNQALGTVPAFISLSLYPYATKIGLFKVLAYIGVFFLVINWADSKEKIQGLVYAFVFVGIFESLYGILRSLGGYQHIWWLKNIWFGSAATGTYINRNHLAGLLEITIPITFGLLIATIDSQTGPRKKINNQIGGIRGFLLSLDLGNATSSKIMLIVFLIAMMVLGLILSDSRGGIISLGVSFFFMNSILLFRKRLRGYAVVSFIICSITLIYGLQTGIERMVQRFENIAEGSEVRLRFAKASMELKKDFPLMGTGWGTFMEAFRRYQRPEDEMFEIDHAHHDWLELGAETGALGLGVVLLSFLFCLGYFFSLWRKRRNNFSIGIGLGGMGAMVSLAIHSFTDFNMHIPANALLLSMAMGLSLAALIYQRRQRKSSGQGAQTGAQMEEGEIRLQVRKLPERVAIWFPDWLRWPLALAVAGVFSYSVLLVVKPYLAERALPTLHDSTMEGRISPSLRNACTAIHYEKGNAEYFHWLASLLEKRRDQGDRDENNKGESRDENNKGGSNNDEDNKDENNEKEATRQREEEWLQVISTENVRDKGKSQTEMVNNFIFLSLKRAIQLNPANPYYHLKLSGHILKMGELFEDFHQLQPLMNASEKELDRSLYFMPESASINFYAGRYWLWKSKVIQDKKTCREAFDRFIYYFKKAYHINQRYKLDILQIVQHYYPDEAVQNRIF